MKTLSDDEGFILATSPNQVIMLNGTEDKTRIVKSGTCMNQDKIRLRLECNRTNTRTRLLGTESVSRQGRGELEEVQRRS